MAASEISESDSLQDLLYGKITDNDLIENIHEWCNENIENIMIFILDRPKMREINSSEETCWFQICGQFRVCKNIDEMYILCRTLYGKLSNEDCASCGILAALSDIYEKITDTLLKQAAYEERMRQIQYFRNKELELEKQYPTNRPPAKKPRMDENTNKPEEKHDDVVADNSTKDETSVICVDDDDDDDDSDVEFNHLAPGEDVIGGMPSVSKKSPKFGEN